MNIEEIVLNSLSQIVHRFGQGRNKATGPDLLWKTVSSYSVEESDYKKTVLTMIERGDLRISPYVIESNPSTNISGRRVVPTDMWRGFNFRDNSFILNCRVGKPEFIPPAPADFRYPKETWINRYYQRLSAGEAKLLMRDIKIAVANDCPQYFDRCPNYDSNTSYCVRLFELANQGN